MMIKMCCDSLRSQLSHVYKQGNVLSDAFKVFMNNIPCTIC